MFFQLAGGNLVCIALGSPTRLVQQLASSGITLGALLDAHTFPLCAPLYD